MKNREREGEREGCRERERGREREGERKKKGRRERGREKGGREGGREREKDRGKFIRFDRPEIKGESAFSQPETGTEKSYLLTTFTVPEQAGPQRNATATNFSKQVCRLIIGSDAKGQNATCQRSAVRGNWFPPSRQGVNNTVADFLGLNWNYAPLNVCGGACDRCFYWQGGAERWRALPCVSACWS